MNRKEKTSLLFIKAAKPLTKNKWKGGRLKERYNTHAQMNEQLTYSFTNGVYGYPEVCWLSPMVNLKRLLRGKKNWLNCLVLLIENVVIRRKK